MAIDSKALLMKALEEEKSIQVNRTALKIIKEFPESELALKLKSNLNDPDNLENIVYKEIVEPILEYKEQSRFLWNTFGWTDDRNISSFNALSDLFYDLTALMFPEGSIKIENLLSLPLNDYQEQFKNSKNIKMLEIGVGTGIFPRILRKAGYDFPIHGIDIGEKWIEILRQKKIDNLTAQLQDVIEMDDQNCYNCAMSYSVFHHVENIAEGFKRVFNSLKQGAPFVYSDVCWEKDSRTGEVQMINLSRSKKVISLSPSKEVPVVVDPLAKFPQFKPHPDNIPEWKRDFLEIAQILFKIGFEIREIRIYNPLLVTYLCLKPV